MSLNEQIEQVRSEIRTDGYPMSIGEWISLYENSEIDIHPEFQRFYRWTEPQKSRLIESILLGIPIPPIFVSQRKDGVWDVVDGLQRLSTIYQFVGILKDENSNNIAPLALEGTSYLPALQGKKWNDPDDKPNSLSAEERLLIKRSKISVSIILRESDERAKYELFQRLNTGGTSLTPQEVRNCILVMVSQPIYTWLRELASFEPFQECISLSDRPLAEQYDMELTLRFLIFSTIDVGYLSGMGDVGAALTEKMIALAEDPNFDRNAAADRFRRTFEILARTTGSHSFHRFDQRRERFLGGFILSAFEVVSFGLGWNIDNPPDDAQIEPRVRSVWERDEYTQWSGSGITATRRLPKLESLAQYSDTQGKERPLL